jgi:3-hydroxyisobutyrate dehydrogenase-like beta-hydroxyacid dehydrogenase
MSDIEARSAPSGRPDAGAAREIGFVGLGAMGNPMAANLLAAGHSLVVTDLREAAAASLIEAGATWASTPAEVARHGNVVFLSLPNPSDVEEVVTGPDGVLAGAAPGLIIVDLSTNDPAVARSLAAAAAERGVDFLDAPVSGGVEGARRGRLAVMAGGNPGTVEAVRPLLEVIGDRVFAVGPVGSGNVVKLLNNMMFFVNLLGSLEALVVGAKAGIDPEVLREVVKAGSGGSSVWEFATRAVLADRLAPRFTVALAAKDIALASALADDVGVAVPMGQLARQLIHQYRDGDHGGEDVFGLVRMIEQQAGFVVRGTGTSSPPAG